ncbi:MAG: glycosyltransferase family 9 protein [Candidatus Latescibacteria bacterium]|nr:glycosyltransferase family 9 protein [Candidatus Latescibacterota bacterium]
MEEVLRIEVITRILIIRAGALGDTILLFPTFAALRHRFPNALIEAIGYPTPLSLALYAGYIDWIRSIDDAEMVGLFEEDGMISDRLRSSIGGADLIVAYCCDPNQTLRRNLHRYAPHARVLVVDPFPPTGLHAADWYLTPLRTLDIPPDGRIPRMVITREDRASGQSFLTQHRCSLPVLAVHPGSGGKQKCWLTSCFAEVVDRFIDQRIHPLLICGPADRAVLGEVKAQLSQPDRVVYLEDLPLLKLAAVLSACDGFLGNDSGVTHLAAAVGCPTVALFGPTDPVVWGPRGRHVTILSCEGGWVDVDTVMETLLRNTNLSTKITAGGTPYETLDVSSR